MEHISAFELWEFIDGDLGKDKLLFIEEHLRGCAHCREEYDLLLEVESNMHFVSAAAPDNGFAIKVTAKLVEKRNVIPVPVKNIFLSTLGLSFTFCLVLPLTLLKSKIDPLNGFQAYVSTIDPHWFIWIGEGIFIVLLLLFVDNKFIKKRITSQL